METPDTAVGEGEDCIRVYILNPGTPSPYLLGSRTLKPALYLPGRILDNSSLRKTNPSRRDLQVLTRIPK